MDGEPGVPSCSTGWRADFVEHGYDLKRLIATIIDVARLPDAAPADGGAIPRADAALTAEQFADAIGAITGDWHVYQPANGARRVLARVARRGESADARALGRPIRDQVFGTRDSQATTLQALELVNGETLTHWLLRGARKMLGELPPEPVSLFDKPVNEPPRHIAGVRCRYLAARKSSGCWCRTPVRIRRRRSRRSGPTRSWSGRTAHVPLASLSSRSTSAGHSRRRWRLRVKTPSRLVYDIAGKGFTRFRGAVGIENREITSDLNPRIRFFIFDREPNMDRSPRSRRRRACAARSDPEDRRRGRGSRLLVRAGPRAIRRRAPRRGSRAVRGRPEGLADLLWAVLMKPEFQLIY